MTLRAGIIGTGGIAGMGILGMHDAEEIGFKRFEESHAGGYESSDDIELVAISDVDQERIENFGAAWNIPSEHQYTDHLEMLRSSDLDVLSICTPTYLHHEHVRDAVDVKPDLSVIWCEKPIASSVADAEMMIESCEQADVELIINHSFRFTKKLQTLRDLLRGGIIGEIKTINALFRRELLRNSTHLIDTLIYLLDAKPAKASGYINGENDAVNALDGTRSVDDSGGGGFVIMQDDTFVTIDCTLARDISSMSIQVIGTEGKIYLNNDDGVWKYWDLTTEGHVEKPLPGIDGAWSWEVDYSESFANAVRHITDLSQGSEQNYSPPQDASKSLEVIVGFYISHFTGSHVTLPLDNPLRNVTITSW